MGGGFPSHSTAEEDDPWTGHPQGNESPWASDSGFDMDYSHLASTSRKEAVSAAGLSTFEASHRTSSFYGLPSGPDISWRVGTEAGDNRVHSFSGFRFIGENQVAASEMVDVRDLTSRAEETLKDIQLNSKVRTDVQKPSVTTSTSMISRPTSESLEPVHKRTFKLMQIENDNQDLSFVEKVILSREEIFSLCNIISAGSARSSEGRRVIDFGNLDCKSMKVVGFFGSKDVMRDIFSNTKFREQRDVWMQTQNDTLAPGLYAWLEGDFVFVFYWHQGHSLPEATRKDMSCNFIRYVFDLCDTVCICVEGKNFKNSLFENAPKFSKRQRTQRLQISLVKASEDSVKVLDGFMLKGLSLGKSNSALTVGRKFKSQTKAPLKLTSSKSPKNPPFGSLAHVHNYKVSEGVSRIAMLFSSTRPRKLSSVKVKEEPKVSAFPTYIETHYRDYNLDFTHLCDLDFVVFIRSAKLKEVEDYEKLVGCHAKRMKEEKEKVFTIDQLVEKEQEHLSHRLEAFIDLFLRSKYLWEEKLMLLTSGAQLPMEPEVPSKPGSQSQQRSEQAKSDLLSSTSVNLSTQLSQIQSELHPPLAKAREAMRDRSSQLENEIYEVIDKHSKQRMVLPNSVVYLNVNNWFSGKHLKVFGMRGPCVFTLGGTMVNNSSKFMPICYGDQVVVRSLNDVSVPPITGKVNLAAHQYDSRSYESPLFTGVGIVFTVDGSGEKVRMTLEPGQQTGDLSEWLNHLVADMISPCGWKHTALLSAVARQLAASGFEDKLTMDLARRTLVSENPLDLLETMLPESVREIARRNWEELRAIQSPSSAEMRQIAIDEGLKEIWVDIYNSFRSDLKSRICALFRRCTTSLLYQKVRQQCSVSSVRLEMTLKKEEAAFLASQKEALSTRNEGTLPLTCTFETCKVIAGYLPFIGGQKLSISLSRQEFERESITWYGFELAPMKEDLDHLIVDNEHAFSPSCSASQEIIDLDPSSQTLLKVVFLKGGQLLVFVTEGTNLRIYLCPKLGEKLSETNCIRNMSRGFDLIAYDERSRFIAMYDTSTSTIKTYRFDETFRHMDWTGVDVSLSEYSIGRLIWMDFVSGKSEIVFIDDLHRARLCDVNQPGMVRSGNVHIGKAPIVKACVATQGSCLLLLRHVRNAKATHEGIGDGVQQHAADSGAESGDDHESEGLDIEIHPDSERPSAESTHKHDGFYPESMDVDEQCVLTLDVYKLDDSIQYVSSTPLDTKMKDWSTLEVGLVTYSSQTHLVIFDSDLPTEIASKVIKISSASEVCQLQQVMRPEEAAYTTKNSGDLMASGPVLDYIYQVFEKYSTSPPLSKQSRDLNLRVVLKGSDSTTNSRTSLSDKCLEYVNTSLDRLRRDKGKDFSALDMHISVHEAESLRSCIDLPWREDVGSPAGSTADSEFRMGTWVRKLVCLVPIQIARAEHNALKPMIDGLQLSNNVDYVDAISLANVIRVGLYETVFDSWKGPVKVISSMGKQSSGKSYLLNHLSGSLLDVAGGRCTDGVWMSLRQGDSCLYVLLDFEGLGSFERSEQEDMLLSMLNAAISNLTIFNKKDFHLDKETEAIFERFQSGVSLVKTDGKLFRGLFYMAIKDVDSSDVEDLKKEFFSKISQICSKSQDNFLTRMYGGSVEISAMPSFNRPEFHESIADIARTVEELDASYLSGRSFLLDLKLVIAQISTKDWSPIDSKRVALRINLLRNHLQTAVSVGCFVSDGISKPLVQFDDSVEIQEETLTVDNVDFPMCDTALELTDFRDKRVTYDNLLSLLANFKSIIPRKGEKDEEWHSFFERFLSALVLRRKRRVLQWITLNTSDFPNDGDVQKLHLEAVAQLAEVQQNLLLCSCKCERCFLRCVQEKGHPSSHSCLGDHRCVAMCTYCLDEEGILGSGPCNDVAGHAGPHDCKQKSHTCGKCCTYASTSSNCNGNCSKKSGHAGDHQCNSRQHTCNQLCSLPCCKNPCVSPIDVGDHQVHACHEKFCPVRCTMNGCNRTCATRDHFHGREAAVTHHFCGSEHPCPGKCDYKGNCEVLTEVSKKTQTFTGRRATFDYVLVSDQNGNRKGCCMVIPPFEERHEGPHSHSSNPDAVHFCETRCPSCGYFCTRPMEHGGLHTTTHGNMRDVSFVAESEEIDIQDRKYSWGESGVAEMCQMHCKAQGRGHTHLIYCPANKAGGTCRKLFDGAKHETRKYGPDFDVPKDEMTHAAFWEFMRFEDPCSAEEQKQFALCNHQCKSDEHNSATGVATNSAVQNISYCTEVVWHQPLPKTHLSKFGNGYITDDGHHFSCDHSTNVAVSVIFVIDISSSMDSRDVTPSMTKFSHSHNNRLGCVYEAILRFIRTRLTTVQEDIASVILFNHAASTVVSLQEMKEGLVDALLRHKPTGSTTYSTGLQSAENLLLLATQDARLSRKSPIIIFLSDGGNNGGGDPLYHVRVMKALDPKLQLHTIMFGNDPSRKILEDMAKAGDGTFEVSLDEVQLSRRFEGLAKSLRPQVASLL